MPLALYGAATGLLEPLAPLVLAARAWRGKEDADRLTERLGRSTLLRPHGPLAWLHGVSVGETMSLLPLVKALRARRPDLNLLVTSGTVTSAKLMADRLPDGVIHQFAPVDAPRAVASFLDHWRPGLAVFVESELWPNMILAAKARGARLALLSARMTQKSADGWRLAPASARAILQAFDLILPQDAATEARLRSLGGAPGPQRNLKTVAEDLPCDPLELERLRAAAAGRKVVLAASTHAGEEGVVAAATPPGALLIVVPRHPDRGAAVAAELQAPRRTVGDQPDARPVYVADTLGELGLFMRLADVVVMGGGWAAGVGGHNPLEAARLGKPVISGPHVHNAAELYDGLVAAGAAVLTSEADVGCDVERVLVAARAMGEAGSAYARAHGAAFDTALALLEPLLPS